MTADWAELPYALLKKVSGRIINEVRGINRVTYDVSSSRRRRSSGSEQAAPAVASRTEGPMPVEAARQASLWWPAAAARPRATRPRRRWPRRARGVIVNVDAQGPADAAVATTADRARRRGSGVRRRLEARLHAAEALLERHPGRSKVLEPAPPGHLRPAPRHSGAFSDADWPRPASSGIVEAARSPAAACAVAGDAARRSRAAPPSAVVRERRR